VAAYTRAFTDLPGWAAAPLTRRLVAPVQIRRLVAFLLLTTGYRADADYVGSCRSEWGHHARIVHPGFADTFHSAALSLGFSASEARRQWCALAKIAVVAGEIPNRLTDNTFHDAAVALTAVHTDPCGRIPIQWSTPLHGLKATTAALGVIADTPPTRLSPSSRHTHWRALAERAPQLVETLRRYLTQIEVSMRPGSVALIDTTLRHLAVYLTDHHPDITGIGDIRRTHIEGFKTFLTSKPGYRGKRGPAKTTTGMRLGHLRGFFDRIIEWDYPDAPARNPVFAGDMPIRDRPLPRFLPDAAAAPCSPPPEPYPTYSIGSLSRSLLAPACARASSSALPATRSLRSARTGGYTLPSANSIPTATYPCIHASKNFSGNGFRRTHRNRATVASCSPTGDAPSPAGGSTRPFRLPRQPPGSGTSPRTNSGTLWPRRLSTEA
jgi:hypothetical protein